MNNTLSQKINSAVIIFAKYPEPKKVKTRLASTTSEEFATEFYRICAENIFGELQKIEAHVFLFLPESDNSNLVKSWAGKNFIYKKQIGNSLGEKMQNAFEEVFNSNYNSAVIIGTDIPEISKAIIESAFNELEFNDVVISPSDDGGYSLLGMNKLFPFLFNNIQWSTSEVFPKTIARLKVNNTAYKLLPEIHDIDTLPDLVKFLKNKNDSGIKNSIKSLINNMNIKL